MARHPHVALLVETSLASGRDILAGIARYVKEHGPWALYVRGGSLDGALPTWLKHWKGDGIIARVQSRRMARRIRATGIPAVDVLGEVPDAGFPLVHVDDRRIAQLAVEHLQRQGFRHFAFLGLHGLTWSEARGRAFRELAAGPAGQVHMLELPPDELLQLDWEAAEDQLAQWVATLPKPVGVMLCSDQLGPAFFEGCRRAGVVAPGEVAVIGVDNDRPLCEVCEPPLSSIRAGHEQVGYAAAARLAAILDGRPGKGEPLWVEPEGVVSRLSTEVLAVEDRQVAEALRFIRAHGCRKLGLDAIARAVGLSRSVLQRRFRSLLGRTVHEEVLALRLNRACELLAESDLSIADIAERCGFTHQEYLGFVFKARLRVTPAAYRRRFGTSRAAPNRRRVRSRSVGLG